MSRTYRHTKGDKKIITGKAKSYFQSDSFNDFRNPDKIKGGVLYLNQEDNSNLYNYLLRGFCSYSIPKEFRKIRTNILKCKLKNEIKKSVMTDNYDNVGNVRFIKDAGKFYY